ncbi:MAG: prenyltransferase/squalene oxidase repeat-containing protein, partial [Actinomycetota bacterium]
MKRVTIIMLVSLILLSAWPAGAVQGDTSTVFTVNKALAYLKGQQQADGSYIEFDGPINATSGVALAVLASGLDLNEWKQSGASTIDFLRSQADVLRNPASVDGNSAKIAQLVMVLTASGNEPRSFAGTDWVAILKSIQNGATGAYGSSFIQHPWVIMALRSAGETIPQNAADYLVSNQEDDGGFGVNGRGSGSDTNTTAICLEALAAIGQTVESAAVQRAVAYLHTQQNEDGGFPWAKPSPWGTDSDVSSTAWVIQGLIAAGEDQVGLSWTQNGNTPVSYLIGMQNPSGAFAYQSSWPDDNLMSTYQVIPALMGKAFPLDYTTPAPSKPVFVSLYGGIQPINVEEGQTITINPYVVKVCPSSPFGIAYVEFFIDGILVGTASVPDADGVYSFIWDTGKYHGQLRVVAYDIFGARSEITR